MKTFEQILVHTDTRHDTKQILQCALRLARKHQACLTLVDTIPDFPWPAQWLLSSAERVVEAVTNDKGSKLQKLCDECRVEGVEAKPVLLDGKTSVGIIREAIRGDHDLVIRVRKGPNSRREGFFGTTATRLLRKCPCPVLLLDNHADQAWSRVVAAVDASSEDEVHTQLNKEILEVATAFTAPESLEVVHAWTLFGESLLKEHLRPEEIAAVRDQARSLAEQRMGDLVHPYGMSFGDRRVHVLHGDADERIPEWIAQRGSDLLVMGTIGRSGLSGILVGNTAERILQKISCSVVTVKPPGFRSPIALKDRQ